MKIETGTEYGGGYGNPTIMFTFEDIEEYKLFCAKMDTSFPHLRDHGFYQGSLNMCEGDKLSHKMWRAADSVDLSNLEGDGHEQDNLE